MEKLDRIQTHKGVQDIPGPPDVPPAIGNPKLRIGEKCIRPKCSPCRSRKSEFSPSANCG